MPKSNPILLTLTLLLCTAGKQAQFEQERAALLLRIQNIQRILAQTAQRKQASTGRLTALNRQIETNTRLIHTIGREIRLLNQEIQQKQRAITTLGQDLTQLKKEYAAMVYVGTKALQDIHSLMFIFAAPSFQALVQRLRYVKQYASIRQQHFREIGKVMLTLQAEQAETEQRKKTKSTLLRTHYREKTNLAQLQQQQTQLLGQLEHKHTQLAKELKQRNRAVKRLNKLITDIVQQAPAQPEEAHPPTTKPTTRKPPPPISHKKLTARFRKSRRKLPWPVHTGFISSKFGIRPHPVLPHVRVENLGIDIQTQPGTQAHAIFEGIVKTIAYVPGMHRVIIIQHGDYHTVYARLRDTTVRVGQHLQAGQPLGTIYTDPNGITELQLQLWKRTQKLNPAAWLRKR